MNQRKHEAYNSFPQLIVLIISFLSMSPRICQGQRGLALLKSKSDLNWYKIVYRQLLVGKVTFS